MTVGRLIDRLHLPLLLVLPTRTDPGRNVLLL